MSDEFDPNWPHGHLVKRASGDVEKVRILATDIPREHSIAFCLLEGNLKGAIYCHLPDGTDGISSRLINAPAPVKHAEAWVNVYRWPSGKVSVDYVYETIDKARHGEDASYLGSIRISTETADIIGPNGEKVKL